jgi:hypothetical protein
LVAQHRLAHRLAPFKFHCVVSKKLPFRQKPKEAISTPDVDTGLRDDDPPYARKIRDNSIALIEAKREKAMENLVLEDAFTFYVCNPEEAAELLQQAADFKAGLGVVDIQGDYQEEYEAARDALASLNS